MSQAEEQFKETQAVWTDSWKFYKKYHGCPAEPGMWESATKDFGEILRKHDGSTVCARIMIAAFSRLEEETR